MLLLTLIISSVNFVLAGYVPKILLVASAHGIPLSTIMRKVTSRRHEAPPTVPHATTLEVSVSPSIFMWGRRASLVDPWTNVFLAGWGCSAAK